MVTESVKRDVKETSLKPASLEVPPEPPDSGWAWMVLVGGFFTEALLIGFLASVSVYVYVWMEYFDGSAAETSLIVSLCSFVMGVMSPVAGASCSKYGARATAMTGGVLTTTGMLISSQATDTLFLIFSLGIFTGFGISLSFNPVFVSVGMYFNKRLKLAFGLAATGVGIGQLAFPPLYNYLIDQYGWRGSMMILAAMTFHLVAAGALIRPLKARKRKIRRLSTEPDDTELEMTDSRLNNNEGEDEVGTDEYSSHISRSDNFDPSSRETPLAHGSVDGDADVVSITTSNVQDDNKTDSHSLVSGLEFGFSAMENRYWNTFVVAKLEHPPVERFENATQESFIQVPKSVPLCTRLRIHLKKTLTFLNKYFCLSSLICNRSFVIHMIASALHGYGWASTTYHTVARAESVGIETDASALLLTFVGIGSLIGRINIGWIMDKNFLRVEFSYCLALLVCSVATFVIPTAVVYWLLAVTYVVQGMSSGAAMVAIMLLPRIVVKPQETTASTALVLLAWGIGEITGGFMAGYFYDSLGSYDWSFYAAGSMMSIAALLTLLGYFLQRVTEERRHSPAPNEKVDFVEAGLNELDAKRTETSFEDRGAVNPIFFTTEQLDLGNLEYGNEISRNIMSEREIMSVDNEWKHVNSYHGNVMTGEEVIQVEFSYSNHSNHDSEELDSTNKTMCVKEVTVEICSDNAFVDDRKCHDDEIISDHIINSAYDNLGLEIENESDDTLSANISHESDCSQDICYYEKDPTQSSTIISDSELSEDSGIDILTYSQDFKKECQAIESSTLDLG